MSDNNNNLLNESNTDSLNDNTETNINDIETIEINTKNNTENNTENIEVNNETDTETENLEVNEEIKNIEDENLGVLTEEMKNDDSYVMMEGIKKPSVFKNKMLPIMIIVLVIVGVGFLFNTIKSNYIHKKITMPTSHVYVCDNPNHKSDFDNWLHDEVEVDWVPEYVIIRNGTVIGKFPGDIDEDEFSSKLSLCAAYNIPLAELPNYSISNINGDRKSLKELFGDNKIYVLEIHWIDCKDCKEQDEKYTDSIYSKHTTDNIYRYYVKSDINKVKEKYDTEEK